jgi:hypothetical protein
MDKTKSRNNIQNVDFSAKCGCIICTTIIYQRTINILVCSICQKLANVLSYAIQESQHPNFE